MFYRRQCVWSFYTVTCTVLYYAYLDTESYYELDALGNGFANILKDSIPPSLVRLNFSVFASR